MENFSMKQFATMQVYSVELCELINDFCNNRKMANDMKGAVLAYATEVFLSEIVGDWDEISKIYIDILKSAHNVAKAVASLPSSDKIN